MALQTQVFDHDTPSAPTPARVGLMRRLLLALCLSSCLETNEPIPETRNAVQIGVFESGGGCALSKVRIYDDAGDIYQAEGCTHGQVIFPPGRRFVWVDSLGTQLIGFNVIVFDVAPESE
jgi:hypothetical protein